MTYGNSYRNYLEEYLLCALYILCNHTGHQGECLFFVISRRFFYKSYNFCNQHAICFSTFKICFSFQINNFKGGFLSESAMCFSNLQFSRKKIFQKTILSLKFKFPAKNTLLLLAGNSNFKLRIVFWNIFFWKFGDLKNELHFLKKATIRQRFFIHSG